MGIFKELFGDNVINVIFNETTSKESLENNNRVKMINELIRWSAICGAVQYKLDNGFLFISEERELKEKLAKAEKEFEYWKRRVAEEMNLDPSKLAHIKH